MNNLVLHGAAYICQHVFLPLRIKDPRRQGLCFFIFVPMAALALSFFLFFPECGFYMYLLKKLVSFSNYGHFSIWLLLLSWDLVDAQYAFVERINKWIQNKSIIDDEWSFCKVNRLQSSGKEEEDCNRITAWGK